jgi:hypothetical protein
MDNNYSPKIGYTWEVNKKINLNSVLKAEQDSKEYDDCNANCDEGIVCNL